MRTSKALILALIVSVAGCGGGGDGGTEPVRVGSVTVTPATPSIAPGGTVQLDAVVKDQAGATLNGKTVTWTSAATSVATVSSSGLVTGISAGTATITAASEGVTGSATVTVTPPPVATVTIAPNAPSISSGETTTLTATLRDVGNNTLTGRTVTWTTSATTVATVTATGATATVTGVAAGTAQITATSEGKSAQVTVTVTVATFSPTANATLGGTRSYASVNIPAGVTITVTSPLTLNVTGAVTIAGTLTGECQPISITTDGVLTVRGTISTGCSTAPDDAGPGLTLVGKGGYEMDDADIEVGGDLTITNNPALTEASFSIMSAARAASRPLMSRLAAAAETRCTYRATNNRRYRAKPPKAKNGADGNRTGQPGKDGGVYRLMCDGDMVFLGGVNVQGRHGGDGGKADNKESPAIATGGAGGIGGNVRILGTGTLTFTGGGNRIQSGDGGKGGDAIAIAANNAPTNPKNSNATATGGNGGDTSKGSGRDGPIWIRGASIVINPNGTSPNSLTLVVGAAGDGGKAEATAPNGQDAGDNPAQNGGDATAKGGDGGKSLELQLNASGSTLGSSDVVVQGGSGGFGGAANGTAGNGGAPNDTKKKGGDGGDLTVNGGAGGNAGTKSLTGVYTGFWGQGGPVQFTGGNGKDGYDECRPRLVDGGLAGKGGTAAGGDGAAGTIGAARPAPGGNTILVNGVGNGAEGGDGFGPAGKGGSGTDNIRAPVGGNRLNTAPNFTPGADGRLCEKAEQFLTWVGRVLNDPAGHNPFVQWLNIPGINFRAIEGILRFTGAAPMVTLQGGWDFTLKKFVVTGSGTVAGRPNTPIRAECTPGANGALVCVITIGGPTAIPPLTTPIVYEFTLTIPAAS